ncbi:DUF6069 family protein [Micromonospora auratinigra]|uniref:Uncharacterized protein n=1 Tax=Micromonospora auratinigra TaxID=261654 RepID=A0A1A8ZH47_9ACTN|nr:DUF6069 family protein [Micromonospora auratinigra]SBT43145.1 hypothetical protein GA0070611_2216 [Micromonospora auratinigra]
MSRHSPAATVALAGATAVAVNLILYGVGRAVGGTFRFTTSGGPAEVDAVTVAGFSAVPLLVGLTAVALLAPRAAWVVRVALVVGPLLAIGTIALMTLPTDFDTASKATLALCHLTLVPITIAAVIAVDRATRPSVTTVT